MWSFATRVQATTAVLAILILTSARVGAFEDPPVLNLDESTSRALLLISDTNLPTDQKLAQLGALAEQNPRNGTIWVAFGEALESAGRQDDALATFDRAADVDPTLYSAWQWIGTIEKRKRTDLPRAEMAFRKAAELGAPAAPVHNELGVTLAMQGRFDDAVKEFDQALSADPDWGILYNNAIKAALAAKNPKLARDYYLRAISAERFEQNALLIWGDYLFNSEQFDKAAADYTLALAKHSNNARIRYDRGAALSRMGKRHRDEAIAELERARADAKVANDDWTMQAAERTLFATRFPDDEKEFQAAVKDVLYPDESAEQKTKKAKKAIKNLSPLIDKHPDFYNARYIRGVAYRMTGEQELARADFLRALEIFPKEGNTLLQMGLLSRDDGNNAEAVRYGRLALEVAPRDPTVVMNLGFIELDAGNCAEATAMAELAEKLGGVEFAIPLREEIAIRCK